MGININMHQFHWGISKIVGLFLLIVAIAIFSKVLAVALLVLLFLSGIAVWLLQKFHLFSMQVATLFFIVTFIYLGATLAIHYTNFYPLGGGEGDQREYHQAAVDISNDFRHGNFSLKSITTHLQENHSVSSYPVFIAVLYSLTTPDKLVGKMLGVWLVGLSALLLYALSLEFGVSKRFGFWVGISPIFYPSYLYWGSLMLRESIVVLLVLLSCLLMMKIQKHFSFALFLLFYFALGALIHFRFYPGLVVLFVFPLSLFFLSFLTWKKKLQYGLFIIPLLGFLPQISGHGYYGSIDIRHYTQPQTIVVYREYVPAARLKEIREVVPPVAQVPQPIPPIAQVPMEQKAKETAEQTSKNLGSTIAVSARVDNPVAFVRNYLTSFSFMLLGPFPWHIRYARQLLVLAETIPWWIVSFFLIKGILRSRHRWRDMLPVLLVSLGILAEIALILNTYGTYMRIRMPAFLLLFTLLPFAFQKDQKEIETV